MTAANRSTKPSAAGASIQASRSDDELGMDAVFRAMGEGLVVYDPAGAIRFANDAAVRLLALDHRAVLGIFATDPRWDVVRADGAPVGREELPSRITARTGRSCHNVLVGVRNGPGARRWLSVSTACVAGEGDPSRGVVSTFADVTAMRAAAIALDESNARMLDVTASIPGVIYQLLEDGGDRRFLFLDGRVEELMGASAAAIRRDAEEAWARVHPDDLPRLWGAMASAGERGAALDVVLRIHAGRHLASVRVCATPRHVVSGTQWTGVMLDVTRQAEQEALIEAMIQTVPVGLSILSRDGALLSNQAYEAMFGAPAGRGGALGFLAHDGSPLSPEQLPGARALHSGEPVKNAIVGVATDGGRGLWTMVHAVPLEGQRDRVLVAATDISERWEYESALADRETRLRVIFDTAVDAIITIGAGGVIEQANPAAERIFGYAARELVGQSIAILMPPPDGEPHDEYLARYAAADRRRALGMGREVIALRRDGTDFPAEISVSEFFVSGERRFTGIIRDVSEQKRIDRQVSEHELRLRSQLAYDLHDSLGQLLAGGRFLAQNLASDLEGDLAQRMSRIVDLLGEALEKVRGLSNSLSALEMAGTSFARALQVLAKKTSARYAIACRVDVRAGTIDPPPGQGNQAYMVVEEALANAARHSGCTAIAIDFSLALGRYQLTVRDDGHGIADEASSTGLGLTTMRHRAGLLGGSIAIGRVSPTGTEVRLEWPDAP